MANLASLVRIFEPTPSDDYVEKRQQAVQEVKDRFRSQKKTSTMLNYANALADGLRHDKLPEPLATEVETAIRNVSSSFVRQDQDVQMLVCGLAAAAALIDECKASSSGWTSSEVFVAALLSSLSFLSPHRHAQIENLRLELVASSVALIDQSAEASRRRSVVPDFSISTVEGETTAPSPAKLKAALDKTVAPLRSNAMLDREEIDLLWWAFGDWSAHLEARVSALEPMVGLVASSLEVVALLRRVPATSHSHITLRNVREHGDASLSQLVESCRPVKGKLEGLLPAPSDIDPYPLVFPALCGIVCDATADAVEVPMTQAQWCKRLVLEAALVRLQQTIAV